jgi:hypothetical protein
MKTMNHTKNQFPRPLRFSIYLFMVMAIGLMNWMFTYAEDSQSVSAYESSLFDALETVPDPEPELESWLLTFSDDYLSGPGVPESGLETRLAAALEPAPEEEPELEEWLLNFSEDYLTKSIE